MGVSKIMTSPVVTVELDDTLSVIKNIFESMNFHHVLVVDRNELIGVISDRDLLRALSPNIDTVRETYKDTACLRMRAHQIMTRKPIFLYETAGIADAIDIFQENRISCIPIVNRDHKPVGIVSWRDLLEAIVVKSRRRSGDR